MSKKITADEFIRRARRVYGTQYDYSRTKYTDCKSKIEIICKTHGPFSIRAGNHMYSGHGCQKCGGSSIAKSHEQYILDVRDVHDSGIKVIGRYINARTPILHNCGICLNTWAIRPYDVLRGHKCDRCQRRSNAEISIEEFLMKHKISFESQKALDGCVHKAPLKFDFYIKVRRKRICIEYDGQHHFQSIWENFKVVQKRDKIKTDFCKRNRIRLIRISYLDEDIIESILTKKLLRFL